MEHQPVLVREVLDFLTAGGVLLDAVAVPAGHRFGEGSVDEGGGDAVDADRIGEGVGPFGGESASHGFDGGAGHGVGGLAGEAVFGSDRGDGDHRTATVWRP